MRCGRGSPPVVMVMTMIITITHGPVPSIPAETALGIPPQVATLLSLGPHLELNDI